MFKTAAVRAFYRATASGASLPSTICEKWLELSQLRRFLAEHRINVVLDVGANVGQFAGRLRRLGYGGAIISFEPDPRAFQELVASRLDDTAWRGYPWALGDSDGTLRFHIAEFSDLSSALSPLPGGYQITGTTDVPVRRWDSIRDEVLATIQSPRILLKTDTQGFDLNVLRGASGAMDQIHGILAELPVRPTYEGAPTFVEALAAYDAVGFDVLNLTIVGREPSGRVIEYDGLFMRRSAGTDVS
jgi:FkbM family methyltransferase